MKWLDSPIVAALGKVGDCIILNFLWIICSVPIFTIGASTAAAHYTMLKLVEDRGDSVIEMFFGAFKSNFKQATIFGIVFTIITVGLVGDFYLIYTKLQDSGMFRIVMISLLAFIALFLFVISLYLWALMVRFENTMKQLLINAFVLAVVYYKKTIQMFVEDVAVLTIGVLGVAFFPQIGILVTIFGISAILYPNCKILLPIINQLTKNKEKSEK